MYLTTLEDLELAMKTTIQYQDLNVYQHGVMVKESYDHLVSELEAGDHEMSKLYSDIKHLIVDKDTLQRYQIYHDCGKPLCKTEDGRFPNHEEYSHQQWKQLFPEDKVVSELIRLDMAFHTYRGDDLNNLWSNPLAPSLYFTAWAEIEANASMFGGRESDSYKIKRKRLIKAGKKAWLLDTNYRSC